MDFVTERIAASPIFLLSLNATSENGLKSSDFSDVATGFVTSVLGLSGIGLAYCFCTKSFLEKNPHHYFLLAKAVNKGVKKKQ